MLGYWMHVGVVTHLAGSTVYEDVDYAWWCIILLPSTVPKSPSKRAVLLGEFNQYAAKHR